ncbi:MAG: NAD(P)H-hydrate dehydratase [Fidelibacterota bacterium]
MRLLTRDQSRMLDKTAMVDHGIPGIELMGNAGKKVAQTAQQMVSEIPDPSITIICGKGNNGGDGFATAAFLKEDGFTPRILSLVKADSITGDPQHYYQLCLQKGLVIEFPEAVPDEALEGDLVIDALLGTGFRGALRSPLDGWIRWINDASLPVLAIDIPSGLDANTGQVNPVAVQAMKTVTMGYSKLGLHLKHGTALTGEVIPADIGFPPDINIPGLKWHLYSEEPIKRVLSPLSVDTYKHRQGKVLIIAGSQGMTGAAILATYGALRSGAGLVVTCAPSSLHSIYETTILEGITHPCDDQGTGHFCTSSIENIQAKLEWCDAVAIGPGLGGHPETQAFLEQLLPHLNKLTVIDADGLRAFHNHHLDFGALKFPFVITPHWGEWCTLTNVPVNELRDDFPQAVAAFMEHFPGVLVLKNAPTVTCYRDLAVVNSTGNPGLATGGTGDVLTGMIAAFLSQGWDPFQASQVAVYLHGKTADAVAAVKSQRGMIASDLLNTLPTILQPYD